MEEARNKALDLPRASSIAADARKQCSRAHGGSGRIFLARNLNTETIMTKLLKTSFTAKDSGRPEPKKPSKLDTLEAMLTSEAGASIAEMMAATGWQQHSVRGALAGAIKKRLTTITSAKSDGERRYRAGAQ